MELLVERGVLRTLRTPLHMGLNKPVTSSYPDQVIMCIIRGEGGRLTYSLSKQDVLDLLDALDLLDVLDLLVEPVVCV